MPYRDDLEAATARRDALTHELACVQQRLDDQAPMQQRARELAAELADATRHLEQARARFALPVLESITVTTPCSEPWAKMVGDDRVRFCGRCDKNVYNLSAMTTGEAEALLDAHGASLCVRFWKRPDGTVLTTDCPVGAKRRRRRRLVVTAVAVAAGALGAVWALTERPARIDGPDLHVEAHVAPAPPPEPAIQGGMSMEPPPAPPPPPAPRAHLHLGGASRQPFVTEKTPGGKR
jgi:hypothetical protein